jgi:hypothetical protein
MDFSRDDVGKEAESNGNESGDKGGWKDGRRWRIAKRMGED